MAEKSSPSTARTHGPIVRAANGKWVSVRADAGAGEGADAVVHAHQGDATTQSFKQTMELHTNSSNNTIYADASGNIAYFHGNFIPKRDPKFDWTKPVDGSDPATEWQGLLSVDESPLLLNPASGWLYNTNNWPWSAAGPSSPKQADYPAYVDSGGESARGLHAIRVLQNKKDFTLDVARRGRVRQLSALVREADPGADQGVGRAAGRDPLKAKLAEQIALLRAWDLRWSATSVPTSLAVFWARTCSAAAAGAAGGASRRRLLVERRSAPALLQSLAAASDKLAADFGTWKTPWGDINRFQRLTDDIVHPFDDAAPSIPVGFTSATLGLAGVVRRARRTRARRRFTARAATASSRWSSSAPTVRARAVTAGGESGDPTSPHFNDQAERYARATCARCTSIRRNSRDTPNGVPSGRLVFFFPL